MTLDITDFPARGATYTQDERVTYKAVLTNTGNVKLTDTKISGSTVPSGSVTGICPDLDVAYQSSRDCTFEVPLEFDILDTESVQLLASASASGPGAVAVASADKTVTLDVVRQLTVVKTLPTNQQSYKSTGNTLDYTITATNSGGITLKNVQVTDPRIPGPQLVCSSEPAEGLERKSAITCTGSYTVKPADVEAKTIDNTATATANKMTSAASGSAQSSMLAMIVSLAPASSSEPGSIGIESYSSTSAIFFNVIVRNAGQAALTGATLQVTDTGAAIGLEISVDTAAQSCQLGSPIPAGETRTCLVTLRPKQDNLDAGFPLVITAAGTATDAVSKESISASSAEVNVPAAQNAKLEYQLTADATGLSTLPAADEPVKYTLKIFNKGNVRLTDVAPAFKVNDAAALLDFSGCLSDLRNSEAGEQLSKTSCEVTRKLKQSDIEKGSLDVTGSLSATYTCQEADCPKRLEGSLNPGPLPSITLTRVAEITFQSLTTSVFNITGQKRTDGLYYVYPGDVITYKLTAVSSGNTALLGVAVSDGRASSEKRADCSLSRLDAPTLSSTSELVCPSSGEASYTVTQDDVDAGGYTITATGSASRLSWNSGTLDGSVDERVPAKQSPAANIVVEASSNTVTYADTTVTFIANISNPGNVRLKGLKLEDDAELGSNACAVVGALDPKMSFSCTVTKTFKQGDIQDGASVKAAFKPVFTVSGSQLSVPASASATVTFIKEANLQVSLSDPVPAEKRADTAIRFTVTVQNIGNWILSSIGYSSTFKACPAALSPGQSEVCTLEVPVVATDFDKAATHSDLQFSAEVTNSDLKSSRVVSVNKFDHINHGPGLSATLTSNPETLVQEGTQVKYTATFKNTGNTAVNFVQNSIRLTVGGKVIPLDCPDEGEVLSAGASTTCNSNSNPVVARFKDLLSGKIDASVVASYTSAHSPGEELPASATGTTIAQVCDASRAGRCPRFQATVVNGKLKPTYLGAFSATCNGCTATVTFKSPFQTATCTTDMVNYVALAVGGRPTQCAKRDSVWFGDEVVLSNVSHGSRVFAYMYDASYSEGTAAPAVVFKDLGRPACRVSASFAGNGYCGKYGGFVVNCGSNCRRN
ncbi:hypothetical protein OEZ85_013615 [Tetradesmus obliquus]|uniref:DUF7507 domain-containing protein n=1 Tax=Tetradesmus obliquus TaxID=3088 RepID=A0ABY8URF1_TETOB|nr:hypothetical protein OEZ85_013615 [Tetradesmus obliquus]